MMKHLSLALVLIGTFLVPAAAFAAYDFQPVSPFTYNGTTVKYVGMSSSYSYVDGTEVASQTFPNGPSMFAPLVDASVCDSLATSAGLSSTSHIWCGFKITFQSSFDNCVFTCQGGSGGSLGGSGVSSSSSGEVVVKLYATEPNIGPLANLAPNLTLNPDGTVTWTPAPPPPTAPPGSDCESVYGFISSGMVSAPGYSPGCYVLTNSVPATAPTATLSATPSSITSGSASGLTHSCTNATSASIDNGVGTVDATSGTNSVSPTSSTTYTLTCTGPAGSTTATATVTVNPPPAPTVTLTATPANITTGQSSTLSWTSTDAIYCVGNGFETGGNTSGTVSTGPLSATTQYSVRCTGASTSSSATTAGTPATPGTPATSGTPATPGTWQLSSTDTSDLACPVTNANHVYEGIPNCPGTPPPTGKACSGEMWTCKVNRTVGCNIDTRIYNCVGASAGSSGVTTTGPGQTTSGINWVNMGCGPDISSTYNSSCNRSAEPKDITCDAGYHLEGATVYDCSVGNNSSSGNNGSREMRRCVVDASCSSSAPAPGSAGSPGSPGSAGVSTTTTIPGQTADAYATVTVTENNPATCVANEGAVCTSNPNSCAQTSSGTIQCNGTCSATTPSNLNCPIVDPKDPGKPNNPGGGGTGGGTGGGGTGGGSGGGTTGGTPGSSSISALLTAFPTTVVYGAPSILSWTSAHAMSCDGGSFSTGTHTSGTASVIPVATTLYSLTCTDASGNHAYSTATVNVIAPTLSIAGSPQLVRRGDPTTITWSVSGHVDVCAVSGPGLSASTVSGSKPVVINNESVFTLSCTAGALHSTVSTTVKILPSFQEK